MSAARRAPRRVTGPGSYDSLRPAAQEARFRALDALSQMRNENMSLTAAAHASGTTAKTVRRYAGAALTQHGRRTVASTTDRLYRRMVVLTPDGRREVDVRSSAQASRVAAHWNALDTYLRTGNSQPLRKFGSMRIGGFALATSLGQIEEYARLGELAIDDIYPHR